MKTLLLRAGIGKNRSPGSPRVEVLELIAEGLRNAEIGEQLFIAAKTVDHHVSAILAKLGLPDRAAVARWHMGLDVSG